MQKHLLYERYEKIIQDYKSGLDVRAIVEKSGYSESTVQQIIYAYKQAVKGNSEWFILRRRVRPESSLFDWCEQFLPAGKNVTPPPDTSINPAPLTKSEMAAFCFFMENHFFPFVNSVIQSGNDTRSDLLWATHLLAMYQKLRGDI